MENTLTGVLIYTNKFGWQVRYEFGQGQTKCLFIHSDSINGIKEFAMEGEEVKFIIRGTIAKRSLNGYISSAFIINEPNKET
jgi:hypothetical protein